MAEFTRLTIIGTARKADLVIPNDESIGGLIPRLMDLLGEATGSVARPLTLVRSTGEQLDASLSAAEQEVADGELLRFVRADDAPPPPEVADVTDVLGESLRDRAGLWSSGSRQLTGAIAIGVLSFVITSLLQFRAAPLVTALVVLVVAAIGFGLLGRRWAAAALTAAVFGLEAAMSWQLAGENGVAIAALVLVGVGWVCLGFGFGVGLGSRPARLGSWIGLALVAVPALLIGLLGMDLPRSAAITAAVSIVACGLLPRFAMAASGLTGLDDQVVEGRQRSRTEVELTVSDAYRLLTWATFAVAIPLAVTSGLLLASADWWAVAVGAVVILVTTLRTRAFPLAVQQMALWLAVLAGLIAGLVRQPHLDRLSVAGILTGLALLVVILVVARPVSHQRAFWRRAGNVLEAVCVIALIPLLLGMFGIYRDLLGAF
jgi:type VII secretion integral membrane protein EccD